MVKGEPGAHFTVSRGRGKGRGKRALTETGEVARKHFGWLEAQRSAARSAAIEEQEVQGGTSSEFRGARFRRRTQRLRDELYVVTG